MTAVARLLVELRRRRVVRTALWYAGSSVAVVQAAHIFLPSFGAPAAFLSLLTIVAVFGLPIALMLSWCFDIAADARPHARSWQQLIAFVAVATVSLLAAVTVWRHNNEEAVASFAAASHAIDPAHIAVLGFDAVGGGHELETFAAHLHSRLIDGLSRAAENTTGSARLRVVSRTGILPYANGEIPLDSLARMFKVGTVLDGTVDQVGDAVRVSVQLIDTESGDILETATAKGAADDQVRLLDAVADAAVQLIRKSLGPIVRERMHRLETRNPAAFDVFMLATQRLDAFQVALDQDDVAGALQVLVDVDSLFAEAERLDPRWIEPIIQRGRLARRHLMIAAAMREHDPRAVLTTAMRHAERAFKLKPNDYRAFELRGDLRSLELSRHMVDSAQARALAAAAQRDLRAALAGNPTPAFALRALSELAASQGDYEEALRFGERAYDEDPYLEQVIFTVFRLFEYSFALGRDGEAAKWCSEGGRRFVDHIFRDCRLSLGAWADDYPLTPDSGWALVAAETAAYPPPLLPKLLPRLHVMMAAVLARHQMPDSARALLRSARAQSSDVGVLKAAAGAYSLLGEPDSAVAMVRAILPCDCASLSRSPELRRISNDRRFQQLLDS